MNNFQIAFIVLYIVSALINLYKLSLGDKLTKVTTNREAGMGGLIGVVVGVPLYLASIGIL
jgi:uncharacterized protein YqgC (DUF456 family)